MPDIQQLPPLVVNQIAAGEVIERPASVVKELVENSVDAGAHNIRVAVTQGGTDEIHVTDDGCGIDALQMSLAVTSHATSKLRTADDLFRVATLGFRGEALASIAAVSQFRLRSRPADGPVGSELQVHGGSLAEVTPCGCAEGTSVLVRNLFFNTPVRRRFLRTVQTEMGHVWEALARIALPHFQTRFQLLHNDREAFDLPPVVDWRQRIRALFGEEVAEGLLHVTAEADQVRISGFVGDPSLSRGNNRLQYLFLNGRYIRDRALSHALSEAYRGLLMTGRFPIAFLRLDMPPEGVDVNVHPTKLEVRFREGHQLYGQVLNMVRSKFLATDLTARARLAPADEAQPAATHDSWNPVPGAEAGASPSSPGWHTPSLDPRATPEFRKFPAGIGSPASARQAAFELQFPTGATPVRTPAWPRPADSLAVGDPAVAPRGADPISDRSGADGQAPAAAAPETTPQRTSSRAVSADGRSALQVYNRYLITETEEGVVVIDQHALHERILYEEIRGKVMADAIETQRLLVPEPVQMTPAEHAAILDNSETLRKLGMEVEPFGGDTILISGYPAMLANINPGELLRQVAEQLLTPATQLARRDLLDGLLHMISCKAAIKAGDRLTAEEINTLLERRHKVQDAHHCPHGRPTALIFSREELDRRFKRI